MQTTIRSAVTFKGFGLHSGKPARMTIHPASAEHGIWFKRVDLKDGDRMIPALWDVVRQSPLCTTLVNATGVSVSTVEHVMAALAGCGVHNALIEIDGPEVPILDGSSAGFVRGVLARGVKTLAAPVRAIRILDPVSVHTAHGWARLSPAGPGTGLTMAFHIDFDEQAIGVQDKSLNLANGAFVRELCDCRTFCRQVDVEQMQAAGLALGGIPGENAVVFDGAHVQSGAGLRHRDEPVRHKMLDALGDLYLAGAPIIGHYEGHKAGHSMTNALLRELFANPLSYRVELCDSAVSSRLPGAGVSQHEIPAVA